MAREISASTVSFIRRYIHSVEQLEILLLLQSRRDRAWSVESIDAHIRSNLDSVARHLADMAGQGLVQGSGSREARLYQYGPESSELNARIEELAELYRERRVSVVELIFAEPPSPIQGFADAFRIRKEDNDG